MIDSKITYKDSPNAKKDKEKLALSEEKPGRVNKKKDEITIEKMVRKPNKFFFMDLNTVLLR